MDKLRMQTENLIEDNIEFIGKKFPNCIVEAKNQEGKLIKAVDFDLLRQELSNIVVDGDKERYVMIWPDKKQAILTANAPTSNTLRPCKEKSSNFDTTRNIYIEGDNLDVLKIIRETYLGKVKMIYIDPPYNTGNDFIYNDDFAGDVDEYLEKSNQIDERGNKLVLNSDSNGRFHTDWLNMIYPRLKISKDLLKEDGVIFISIDDNEQANLKKVCDEIFGANNFVACCTRRKNKLVMKGDKTFKSVLESLLVYAKNKATLSFSYKQSSSIESDFSVISAGYGEKEISFKPGTLKFRTEKGQVKAGEFSSLKLLDDLNIENFENINEVRVVGEFKWGQDKLYEKLNSNAYILIKNIENMTPRIYFKTDSAKPLDYIDEKYGKVTNEDGLNDLKILGLDMMFSYPKPVDFIKFLANIINDNECLILDFFSGSATTAHAVMQLNAQDGGHRKFIMIQLPEICDEKSEAYKGGYSNICSIGEERIRRAGARIKEQSQMIVPDIDVGFRVFQLDTSNMKDTYYKPAEYSQSLLDTLEDNIKPDRTPEDLLFQVMLDLDLMLDCKIEERKINGKRVFIVGEYNEKIVPNLICCFDTNVDNDTVIQIAKMKPIYAVFRDSSMSKDSTAINFDQIFDTYSPGTKGKVL